MTQIALLGNPNTGKTSLFNQITGSYEYVGNWTGVTVEKKVGQLKKSPVQVVDLPGVYSTNPISKDESVVTRFLLNEPFSSVLNILDASQLERNLYLSIQLLEFGKPIIMAVNMIDVAKGRGIDVDLDQLQKKLGVQAMPVVARAGKGCQALLDRLRSDAFAFPETPFKLDYGQDIEGVIERLSMHIQDGQQGLSSRWLILQYLEGNADVTTYLETWIKRDVLENEKNVLERTIRAKSNVPSLQVYIRQVRGHFISELMNLVVTRTKSPHARTLSERLDLIVTNKYLGIPIFLFVMLLIFELTFDWIGTSVSGLLDQLISGPITDWVQAALNVIGATAFIKAVVMQGIIAGVGGVLVFVPQIFILFFLISLIEDSGYMARVAMVMDRVMEAIGLNGKAFIPMIIGFGCNVPGVMATRAIEQPKERLLTILLTPLMSCSARLTVYSLFVGTFFSKDQSLVVFSLYVLGILVALGLAKLFSSILFKEEKSMFFIELPPYRVPQWKALLLSTWDKGKGFIRKAGTFIFGGSVVIWFLSYAGPHGLNVPMDQSFLAMIGGLVAPLLKPLGFGNWQAGAALITGFLAKEVVVSSMNIIYAAPDMPTLRAIMTHYFTPLQAYSFMAFVLLYIPCLATVAVIIKETGSKKWTWFSVVYSLGIAYAIGLIIYQGGRLIFGA